MNKNKLLVLLAGSLLAAALAGCQAAAPAVEVPPALADPAHADPAEVSVNGLGLKEADPTAFQLLVAGHIYGTQLGDDRIPAETLTASLPELKTEDISMLVSLGDMVSHAEKEDFDILDKTLLNAVPFPVFNTVGNHDVRDRQLYESRYGAGTYYSFRYGPVQMIFLDTELTTCEIDDTQRAMVETALESALADAQVQEIFIFMHKTLFFKNDALHAVESYNAGPNSWECYGSDTFARLMEQRIEPASQKKPVYLFAGDVGAWGNLSPYYETAQDGRLTMVMTGLGDLPSDAAVLVAVDGAQVTLTLRPLTDQPMQPLEDYSPEYWTARK